jgi:apolipoprotein N-acyltransferase
MATTMTEPAAAQQPAEAGTNKAIVDSIIDRARSAPAAARGALTLSLCSAALMWACFTPLDWGPLGWVCLVPLILAVRLERPSRWMYRMLYLGGLAFSLLTLQWMRLGDVWMYPAWIAMSLYMALYFPVFVGLSRVAVHRFQVPLTLAVPVVWVGLEYLRAHLMTGFAWYFLGHTQHQWNMLIQISDVFGAYGVSFLVALGNAVVAGMIGGRWLARWRLLPRDAADDFDRYDSTQRQRVGAVAVMLVLLSASLVYGVARRAQAQFAAGPRVALVQGDFPSSLKHDPLMTVPMFETHKRLTAAAVMERPDVIVWPETMFSGPLLELSDALNRESLIDRYPGLTQLPAADENSRKLLENLSEGGASLIIGLETVSVSPESIRSFNSAVLVEPQPGIEDRNETAIVDRYDKIHRVPFGEYIPFADSFKWVQRMFPFAQSVGIAAGEKVHLFDIEGRWFMPVICFEDTVPHLAAEMIASAERDGRTVDCLVNLTNDGWFSGSNEQEQHLITARFRCVENRTAMVRAVNTGISAIVDGDGLVRDPDVFIDLDGERTTYRDPESGSLPDEINCALVGYVPVDNRGSLYTRYGDWFAGLCGIGCLLLVVLPLCTRRTAAAARTS